MNAEQEIEILQKTKEELIEKEWIKGTFHCYEVHDEEEVIVGSCLYGAYALAQRKVGQRLTLAEKTYFDSFLRKYRDSLYDENIADWNDDPDTTYADVMDFLDFSILELKKEL